MSFNQHTASHELTIAFPGAWGSLVPPTQHTMLGDAILGNEFEPLVDMERGGMITPLAAKSWRISDDMKIFTFKIDTDRSFSDGSRLTAQDFKRSWEDGLKLSSKTAQKSLMDVAYKIAGFEHFATAGQLSGVEAIDDETLMVEFSSPFRMALDHLTGSRFAAYKIVDDHYIGTGPYAIISSDQNMVMLNKNAFSRISTGANSVKVVNLSPDESAREIAAGSVDVYAYAGRNFYEGPCNNDTLGCLDGFESAHIVALVNGLSGRTFSNEKLRKSLQFLLTQTYNGIQPQLFFSAAVIPPAEFDPQPFLPLQAGRLAPNDVAKIIEEGKDFVDDLVKHSQRHPLTWAYKAGSKVAEPVQQLLERHGINLAEPIIAPTINELLQITDIDQQIDFALLTASVVDGDPDGIYHALGAQGAIAAPMSLRGRVSELLEEGRSISDITKLDQHYQKAAIAILEDVPWVHLGFAREKTVYRSDRIKVNYQSIKSRIREPFSIFEPK